MINVQQIIAFFPMFKNLEFPELATDYNDKIIALATFDAVDTGFIDDELYKLPEIESFDPTLVRYDFETPFLIENIGLVIFIIWLHILAFLLHFLLRMCGIRSSRLENYLFWSGSYRLFTESFFDLAMLSTINIIYADWSTDNPSAWFSLSWSVLFMTLVLLGPIMIHIGLYYNRNRWLDEGF